jgi:hypothetical protein
MRKLKLLFVCALMLFIGTTSVALGDWDPGDGHKMHWPQEPNAFGWDICLHEKLIADDFQCTEGGDITDIHFWVSWMDDVEDWASIIFQVDIYDDAGGVPGTSQWSVNSASGLATFTIRQPAYTGNQGWFCPLSPPAIPFDHNFYWQINITDIQEPFPQTDGSTYWLVITVGNPTTTARVGWKTCLDTQRWGSPALWFTAAGGWQQVVPEDNNVDMAFVITNNDQQEEYLEFGDAPESALAYPSSGIAGSFPTCMNTGPAGWIQHNNFGAWFGPSFDFETEGNAGSCPLFNPNNYDQDECFADGDAGLLFPPSYTIVGAIGSEQVVPCTTQTGSLGNACQMAVWGVCIDVNVTNFMPNETVGYVNILMDWNQDGAWGGSSPCGFVNTPEHVLVDFPVPNGYSGPLSGLFPPPFQIGPNAGFVWTRFTITERPVGKHWNGEGSFEDGESECYLLRVKAKVCDWNEGDDHKMHWPQLPDLTPTGIDVDMYWVPLADDWKCSESGPVTDIHMWGSFADNILPAAGVGSLTFQISIYADAPAGTIQPWSMPADPPLWTRVFNPGDYTVRRMADGPEDWYDPYTNWWDDDNHTNAFQYNFCIEENDAFVQEKGTIYWLEIQDLPRPPDAGGKDYTFGWKTTQIDLRWNDDATFNYVYPNPPTPIVPGWNPLHYPDGHEYQGTTLDLAFVITGEDKTIKWSQPPELLQNHTDTYLGWDIEAHNQMDPNIMAADDFLCDSEEPVTAIRWWGSFFNWYDDVLPPIDQLPDAFHLTIWTDTPAGAEPPPLVDPDLKWVQYPDLSLLGMDVNTTEDLILADDFECNSPGYITQITIWGSWLNDYLPWGDPTGTDPLAGEPNAVKFTLSIHDDIPDPDGTGPLYSMPGDVLWMKTFTPDEIYAVPYEEGIQEGWFDPRANRYIFPADTVCWFYTFVIDGREAFHQRGTVDDPNVYWLDVQAAPDDPDAKFGWKTTTLSESWNDDGVWGQGFEPYPGPWNELRYPPTHQLEDESVDLAFAILGVDEIPSYSHPNEIVWENYCDTYDVNFYGWEYDPNLGEIDLTKFEFYQELKPEEWWQQPNDVNIYWLGIMALYEDTTGADPPLYPWGWETRPHYFMDDAVRLLGDPISGVPHPMSAFRPIEFKGVSWDLSYELITEPCKCYGDLTGDNKVSIGDLSAVVAFLSPAYAGTTPPFTADPVPLGYECADVTNDDKVSIADLSAIVAYLSPAYAGTTPPYTAPCMPAP